MCELSRFSLTIKYRKSKQRKFELGNTMQTVCGSRATVQCHSYTLEIGTRTFTNLDWKLSCKVSVWQLLICDGRCQIGTVGNTDWECIHALHAIGLSVDHVQLSVFKIEVGNCKLTSTTIGKCKLSCKLSE